MHFAYCFGLCLLLIFLMLARSFRFTGKLLRAHKCVPCHPLMSSLFSSAPTKDLSIYGENTLVERVYGPVSDKLGSVPQFTKGQLTEVKILRLSSLGATVSLGNTNKKGIILANELDVYHEGKSIKDYLRIGDTIDGFVASIDEDGRILVSLRPSVEKRLTTTRDMILSALQLSPTGQLPVGDKSTPEEIAQFFHGVSKSDFKNAVGTLYKEHLLKPGPNAIALLSDEEIAEYKKSIKPYKEKPHFLRTDPDLCVFVGNLPLSVNEAALAAEVELVVGLDTIDEVRLVRNAETQKSRGFAYVQFKTRNGAVQAMRQLKGIHLFGRKVRVSRASKKVDIIKVPGTTPNSTPLSELRKEVVAVGDIRSSRGTEDALVEEAVARQQQQPLPAKRGASAADTEEQQEDGVDGVLSPEEAEHYMSMVGEDFDPERDFYVFDKSSSSSSSGSSRDTMTRIRSSDSEVRSGANDGQQQLQEWMEEEEPEDYNDVSLYQPKAQQATANDRSSTATSNRRSGGENRSRGRRQARTSRTAKS